MKTFIKREWKLLGFGFLMNFCSIPGQTIYISLFSSQIRNELHLSHAQFSAAYSLATLLSAFMLIFTGNLIDKIALKKQAIMIITLLALACTSMFLTHNLIFLFVTFFLLRHAGQGLMSLCGITALVRYLEHVKGKATALGHMGYTSAEAVMPFISIYLILWLGWRNTWLFFSFFLLAVIVPIIVFLLSTQKRRHTSYLEKLNEVDAQNQQNPKRQWTRKEVIKDPIFFLTLPCLMGHPFLFTGYFFHQIFLIESKGWDFQFWTQLLFLLSITAFLFMFLAGILVDKYGAFRLLPISPIAMMLGTLLLAQIADQNNAFFALLFISISSGFFSSAFSPFLLERYGSKNLGSIKSLFTSLMVLFSSLSPFLLGFLIDRSIAMTDLLLAGSIISSIGALLAYYARLYDQKRLRRFA